MLQSLHVRDLALFDHGEIRFHAGLNVISGATGGGKSLVVTALKLLRGEKAAAGLVRHGQSELRVDGEFSLSAGERCAAVLELLSQFGVTKDDDAMLLVTRIVDAQGRSKVRINDRPATVQALRELGAHLLEIHGQGDSRALMRSESQCEILDAYAGLTPLRHEFAKALHAARTSAQRLDELTGDRAEQERRLEFLRFQVQEMVAVELREGELAALESEQAVLGSLDRLRELLGRVIEDLQDAEVNASGLLARAERALVDAANIDRRLEGLAEHLQEAGERIADTVREVQAGLSRLDLDPGRLHAVDQRLAELRRGLQRFGPTEAAFVRQLESAQRELQDLEAMTASPESLAEEMRQRLEAAALLGRKLQRARKQAATGFCAKVVEELAGLGMASTLFRVAVGEQVEAGQLLESATASGPAPIDFEVSVNQGEPYQSLQKTASGGEIARIVLAIKKCLADQDRVPLLVLDEIDAEIGGRLGLAVGRKLREVGQHHQVVIVTHLPQVAAFADHHFRVAKLVQAGRTLATIERLDAQAIEHELAAMSAGEGADAQALAEARRLRLRARSAEA